MLNIYKEDKGVEGEVPDTNLEPHGPEVEEHEGNSDNEPNEEEEGELASWLGDVPHVESFVCHLWLLSSYRH